MTTHTSAGKSTTDLTLKAMELYGELHRHGRKITKPLGQSPARWQVLGAIRSEPLTVSQIARRMGSTRQNIQRVANVLEREGLIEAIDNPDHKRSVNFRLTQKGQSVNRAIQERQIEWSNQLGKKLKIRAVREAVRTLDDFLVALRELEESGSI